MKKKKKKGFIFNATAHRCRVVAAASAPKGFFKKKINKKYRRRYKTFKNFIQIKISESTPAERRESRFGVVFVLLSSLLSLLLLLPL